MKRQLQLVGVIALLVSRVNAGDLEPLVVSDLRTDIPVSYRNVSIGLRLAGIRPLEAGKGDVVVLLRWQDGTWATNGNTAAGDYNETSANSVSVEDGRFDGKALKATLLVRIGPDGARRGRKAFPTPPDEFRVSVQCTLQKGKFVQWEPDAEAFMPPWRKDTPSFGGELLEGSYEGEWRWKGSTNAVGGAVRGGVNHEPAAGWWGVSGNGTIAAVPGGGLDLVARLPTRQVADGGEAWAVRPFEAPRDWSACDAMRIAVEPDRRRNDLMLAVRVVDASGRSAVVSDAVPLPEGPIVATVPFADFVCGAGRPDWSRVSSVALGLMNRDGIGEVRCRVKTLHVLKTGAAPASGTGVSLTVDPDVAVVFNGAGEIPKGLFGVHDVFRAGKPVKALADQPDEDAYLRAIVPGMFRKIEHTGFGGKPLSDEEVARRIKDRVTAKGDSGSATLGRLKSGDAVDNYILCHTMDLWDRPAWLNQGLEGLSNQVCVFYRNLAANAWVPGDDSNASRKFEVWNEPFMWGRHINMGFRLPPGCRNVTDETQYGYLPGRVGAEAWATLFLAAWDGARKVNTHIQLGGPSSTSFCDDGYRMFTNYVVRILDVVGDRIDFLTEHHYGGDARTFAASYEVVTAWCDIKYGRRIPVYNTEANNLGASDAGRAFYNMLDILTCAAQCPDKARGRALHALWDGYLTNRGEEHAYSLMAPLRGKRVASASSDPDVLCVASCPQTGRLVVVVLNAGATEKSVRLNPIPLSLSEGAILLGTRPAGELQIRDVDGAIVSAPQPGLTVLRAIDVRATPKGAPVSVNLPPGCAVRWSFVQENYEPRSESRVDQHFSTALMASVTPDRPVISTVRFRGSTDGVKRAWVRTVAGGIQDKECVLDIGGVAFGLPPDRLRDGSVITRDIPIDPSLVKPDMKLAFVCAESPASNGFTVYCASVLVER